MSNTTFLLVSGFYSSGSSAVVDLLKEIKGTYECEAEIRIIKDPYGICQLEQTLVHNWELINSTAAITDFLQLCKICSRRGGRFPLAPAGLSYSKTINKDFMKISEEYVEELSKYKYDGDYYYHKFKKNYFRYVLDRLIYGMSHYSKGKINLPFKKRNNCFFSCPTQEQFDIATKRYFDKLYSGHIMDDCCNYIILDQAVSPNNTMVINRYFNDAKMIIVDRDPRDMYIDDMVNWGAETFDGKGTTTEEAYKYVERQKALRKSMELDNNVMYIRFEDLVLNYENQVHQIFEFIGVTNEDHIFPKKYLNPEISSKNVGIWKKYYDKYKIAIDIIASELGDLCYYGNN